MRYLVNVINDTKELAPYIAAKNVYTNTNLSSFEMSNIPNTYLG